MKELKFTVADRLVFERDPLNFKAATFVDIAGKRPSLAADAQVASLINVGISGQVVASAQKSGPVLDSFTVSMPSIMAKIDGGRRGVLERPMHLDTGASFSCILQAAYDRDFMHLKFSGGTPVMLEPLRLIMFNSQHSIVSHMMQGVTFHIGIAEYTLDLLVVPDTQFEYLLGANFMTGFAMKTYFNRRTAELGCVKGVAGQRVPHFQTVPMTFKSGCMTLAIKKPTRYK